MPARAAQARRGDYAWKNIMASLELDSHSPSFPGPVPVRPRLRIKHPPPGNRLALISTYGELCGIAAYTRALEKQLARDFDVTVFNLDQYLLRSSDGRASQFADRHIREICRSLRNHDMVNVQLEFGILGQHPSDIRRRLLWIVRAAPRLSLTFHTVLRSQPFDRLSFARELLRLDIAKAVALCSQHRRNRLLSSGVADRLRRTQRHKPLAVIVHNRRDALQMKYIHGLRNVFDHPLAFLGEAEVHAIRNAASRARFALLDHIPTTAKLIGVFGFLGRYKGFETAVRALHHLPQDYHLLIFGGVHPNEITPRRAVDPVVSELFEAGYIDTTVLERIAAHGRAGGPALSVAVDSTMRDLLFGHPRDLSRRIHFLGASSDDDFLHGMAICDVTVFPYREVGQSASGPIAQALELGCRVIASRTHTFLQFGKYYPNRIEYFDVGNHLELAARIQARPQFATGLYPLAFTVETNRAIYRAANFLCGERASPLDENSC
jgi:glycosyltransferase involved in cell wall biosynthesis